MAMDAPIVRAVTTMHAIACRLPSKGFNELKRTLRGFDHGVSLKDIWEKLNPHLSGIDRLPETNKKLLKDLISELDRIAITSVGTLDALNFLLDKFINAFKGNPSDEKLMVALESHLNLGPIFLSPHANALKVRFVTGESHLFSLPFNFTPYRTDNYYDGARVSSHQNRPFLTVGGGLVDGTLASAIKQRYISLYQIASMRFESVRCFDPHHPNEFTPLLHYLYYFWGFRHPVFESYDHVIGFYTPDISSRLWGNNNDLGRKHSIGIGLFSVEYASRGKPTVLYEFMGTRAGMSKNFARRLVDGLVNCEEVRIYSGESEIYDRLRQIPSIPH